MGTYRRIKGQKNRQNQTGKLLCGPPGFFLAACLCRYIPRWPGINPALPASGAPNALPGPEKDAVSGRRRPFSRFDSSYLNRLTGRTVRVIIKIVFEPSLLRLCSYGALAAPGSRFRVPPETAAPSLFEKEYELKRIRLDQMIFMALCCDCGLVAKKIKSLVLYTR